MQDMLVVINTELITEFFNYITTFERSISSTSFGGRISTIGVLDDLDGGINTNNIIFKNLTIEGIYVGSKNDLMECLYFAEKHKIHPLVDEEIFDFSNIDKAFKKMDDNKYEGKIPIRL